VAWSVLAAIVMVVGLFGLLIPIVPGLLLIWFTALVYGFLVGFGAVGLAVMTILTVLVVISFVSGVVVPRNQAVASGASKSAQLGGLIGAVIGFFVIPVIGLIIGALVGVLMVEMAAKGNWPDAWVATKGVARGFAKSTLIDLLLGVVMITVWSAWALTVAF